MTDGTWTKVLELERLAAGKPATVKRDGKQIALFRDEAGGVFAVDNRCPHEGYPLAAGMVKDGHLTCEWHNWKFRLCDGACILGGEDVRSYPVRVTDGQVWVDLADPPAQAAVPGLYQSLDKAVDELDWSHAARTVERLLVAGESPAQVLAAGCVWAAERAPYGFDHGPATAADFAALLAAEEADADVLLVEAWNVLCEPHVRRPRRAFPEPEHGVRLGEVEAELRRRIEAENVAGAEALFRGALLAGAGPEQVFAWLTHAATDHFLDFGHAHIYVVKAEELLRFIGWRHAHPVLTSLVSMIAYGTREDRLPYMRAYARSVAPHDARRPAWFRAGARPDARLDVDRLLAAVLDGTLDDALAAVATALEAEVAPARIALGLALAAAHRLLRFDPAIAERDVSEDWLDVTHGLTHADAVRESLLRRGSADALRGLFHSARFVQHTQVLDLPPQSRPAVTRAEPELAARLFAGFGQDRLVRPIFVAHQVKTTMAAERLCRALATDPAFADRPDRDLPLVATARFLAQRHDERRLARRTRFARTFVREGTLHTKLLGY